MGASKSDYEKIAPPDSFIHVDDFSTPEKLAAYLRALDADDAAYGRYLRWRSVVSNSGNWINDFFARYKNNARDKALAAIAKYSQPDNTGKCGFDPNAFRILCEKLMNADHDDKIEIVDRLDEWWYGNGYSLKSENFPICAADSGPSGYPLGWLVTLVYTIIYFFFGFCVLRFLPRYFG